MLAAFTGAEVARARYGSSTERTDKEGVDFTTAADIEAERAIGAVLTRYRPDDAIVGEELGSDGESSRRWLVDPICGPSTSPRASRCSLSTWPWRSTVRPPRPPSRIRRPGPSSGRTASKHGDARRWATAPVSTTPRSRRRRRLAWSHSISNGASGSDGSPLLADPVFRARFRPQWLSTTLALAWVATGRRPLRHRRRAGGERPLGRSDRAVPCSRRRADQPRRRGTPHGSARSGRGRRSRDPPIPARVVRSPSDRSSAGRACRMTSADVEPTRTA